MTLHYTELGNFEGETIVYLHGAGLAGWSWQDIMTRLPQYHNMAVDLPGHGDSHTIQARTFADMAHYVADLIADVMPHGKANVVGISLGGMTTLALLEHRPEVVSSVVVSGVNAIPLPFMTKMMTRAMIPVIKSNFVIRQNAKMFQLDEEASAAYFTSMKQLDLETFKNLLPEIFNFAPAEQLRDINHPTLVVAGSQEEKINVKSVSLLANAMNNAVGVLAPDLHHAWSAENPKLFADMVHQWISSQEIATGLDLVVDKGQQVAFA